MCLISRKSLGLIYKGPPVAAVRASRATMDRCFHDMEHNIQLSHSILVHNSQILFLDEIQLYILIGK